MDAKPKSEHLLALKDMELSSSSSEDDDLSYTNAAARLKALKAIKHAIKIPEHHTVEKSPEPKKIAPEITVQPAIAPVIAPRRPDLICRGRTRSKTVRNSPISAPSAIIDLDSLSASTVINRPSITPTAFIDLDDSIDDRSMSTGNNNLNLGDAVEIDDSDTDLADITDDGCLMEVKIRWKSRNVERLELGKNERFTKIFQYFASLENVAEKQILLTRNEIPINQHDTPASINLKIIDILEGGVVDAVYAGQIEHLEEVCKIKIQSSSSTRNCLTYDLGRSEKFEKLVEWCAKEKNVTPDKIKCVFDGEIVLLSDTPDSLDLDDEACIDIQIAA